MEQIIRASGRKQVMRQQEAGQVEYLTFPLLSAQPGITHGFSTRKGGVSRDIYASMNLSFTRGDEEERVQENFRRMAAALDYLVELSKTRQILLMTCQSREAAYLAKAHPGKFHHIQL